jgi:hypothetical protein
VNIFQISRIVENVQTCAWFAHPSNGVFFELNLNHVNIFQISCIFGRNKQSAFSIAKHFCVFFFFLLFFVFCIFVFLYFCVFVFSDFRIFVFSYFRIFVFSYFLIFLFSYFRIFLFSCFLVFLFSYFSKLFWNSPFFSLSSLLLSSVHSHRFSCCPFFLPCFFGKNSSPISQFFYGFLSDFFICFHFLAFLYLLVVLMGILLVLTPLLSTSSSSSSPLKSSSLSGL